MSVETTTAGSTSRGRCTYPGCTRPPRRRAGDKGGKPPIYCDLLNENTGKYAHTPVTARREEQRRTRQTGTNGRGSPAVSAEQTSATITVETGRSATVARERAASLLEQFQIEAAGLARTITTALAEFTAAADPELVRAELDDAHRHVERIQFEATEQVKDAQRERDQATNAAHQLVKDLDEAIEVRDQAIDDLERAERQRDEATAAAEQAHEDAAAVIAQSQQDVEAEIDKVRQGTAAELAQIRAEAAEQITAAQRERDVATVAASRAEAIAQRAVDDAERFRTEMGDLRREHKKELADMRADGKAGLADQAAQLRDVYEAEITRLTHQIATMAAAQTHLVTRDQQGSEEAAAAQR
ncbi:MAG TPA: hypothetical protein VFW65_21780 [Pseudonocardiaceae bacterium]|nr:hypothetical protein [Pseudonocardiaceae bacterium]